MEPQVWSVGHSTRGIDEFIALLRAHRIGLIADVRRFPGSRRYPHFGSEALGQSLAVAGLGYRWIPALGGRRRPAPGSPNTAWKNASFRGYADHTASAEFAAGLDELTGLAAERRVAMMCTEAVWWRCHRRIVSDVLTAQGWAVFHILDEGEPRRHEIADPARLVDGRLSYEPLGPL
ncbi:MAG TPA: DUF488 domain-containing protein, partial [Gemmatimonadales bacterium]